LGTVSVLIVNWNSRDYLKKCLYSIRETCSDLKPQIIVVDSGSYDGCADMVADEFPEVEFVQSTQNIGFGRANNLGFEYVKNEYLLLLNPDTELRKDSLEALLFAIRREPSIGLVGPRLINTDGSLQTSCVQALPTPLNQAIDSAFFRKLFPRSSLWGNYKAFYSAVPIEVEAVSGACMLMPAKVYGQLNGFDTRYFMYAEDMDLCARVRRLGLKIIHVPCAVVVHHGGGSSVSRPNSESVWTMRVSLEQFMRINLSRSSAILYRLLQGLSASIRLALLFATMLLFYKKKDADSASVTKWLSVLAYCFGFGPYRFASRKRRIP